MQICEFKAWFEGFTEDMTKLPTVKQWARIKARIAEIDGVVTTHEFFHDHYWRPYAPYWPQTTWTDTIGGTQKDSSNQQLTGTQTIAANGLMSADQAFTALGKAEAASIAV